MSLSLSVRRLAVCWSLAIALPTVALAQNTTYYHNGSEYPIAGLLAGVQTHPHLSVNALGGFLVWDDNDGDGHGMGIRAVGLNSNLERAQVPFRVSKAIKDDQEHPRVAMLPNGGAIFVWQGGRMGFQHIYARILSPENSWLTDDILVSRPSDRFQRWPAVTTLKNGNAVVAWVSFNQHAHNSMFDIYAQVIAPDGTKIGPEFRMNDTVKFNQRNVVLTTLKDGRFVALWVSDAQRSKDAPPSEFNTTQEPAVGFDICARFFTQEGIATAAEFVVNGTTLICANPAVVSTEDGGFLVAWSQKDTLNPSDGWDVVARPVAATGTLGAERRLNTRTFSDQLMPQLASVGNDCLAVWTSYGQDGDRDGIFGQFLRNDGSAASEEIRINSMGMGRQMQPTVSGDGQGRFLSVWSSYAGANRTKQFDLAAQLFAPADYLPIVATTNYTVPVVVDLPSAVPGIVGPEVALPGSAFPEEPVVLPEGFSLASGSYAGLFYDPDGVTPANSGRFNLTTTARGVYSARLIIGNRAYPVSGRFNAEGFASNTIRRSSSEKLTLGLQLSLGGDNQVRGWLSSSIWTAQLLGNRAVNTPADPSPYAGRYALVIPPQDGATDAPVGYGFGSALIGTKGGVMWVGTMPDGTKVAQSTSISADGRWPLHAAPYLGRGLNLSWVQLSPDGPSGQFVYVKPARVPGRYYSNGFTNDVQLAGSTYVRPPKGTRIVDWSTGRLTLSGAGLTDPSETSIIIESSNRVVDTFGRVLPITINPVSGSFSGKALNPVTGKLVPFSGMFLQNANHGYGYFSTGVALGQIHLGPATP